MRSDTTSNQVAQIYGCREETPTVGSMEQRLRYDIWYVGNWSLLLDLQSILRTAIEVIRDQKRIEVAELLMLMKRVTGHEDNYILADGKVVAPSTRSLRWL